MYIYIYSMIELLQSAPLQHFLARSIITQGGLECAKNCKNLLNLDIKQGDSQVHDHWLFQQAARNSNKYSY